MLKQNKKKWLQKCKKKEVHPELAVYRPNKNDKRLGKYKHRGHTHKTKKALKKCKRKV